MITVSEDFVNIETIYVKHLALWSIHCMQSVNIGYYINEYHKYYNDDYFYGIPHFFLMSLKITFSSIWHSLLNVCHIFLEIL